MIQDRLLAAVLGALSLLPLSGCGERPAASPPKPPEANDVLLTIDGLDIPWGDIEPLLEFLIAAHPEAGRKTVVQKILHEFTIPLHLARRAFPEKRALCLRQATDLCSVAGNAVELDAQNVPTRERKLYSRLQPQLPVARFLFDPLMTGAVSPPIETARGYIVAAAHDLQQLPRATDDVVDATQVGYFTHGLSDFKTWLAEEQARVADKVTYVHPLYREALPTWCRPPESKPSR